MPCALVYRQLVMRSPAFVGPIGQETLLMAQSGDLTLLDSFGSCMRWSRTSRRRSS